MKKYFTLIILCTACCATCFAQTEVFYNAGKYSLNHYTDENGLPQNSIKNIVADKQGFIWMATEEGLVRFDGQKFYTFNKSNLPILTNSFFTLRPRMDIPRMDMPRMDRNGKGGREKGEVEKAGKVGLLPWIRLEAGVDNSNAFLIENGTVIRDSVYFKKVFPYYRKAWLALGHVATNSTFTGKYTESKINSSPYYIPLTSGEGSFFICTSNKVSFYSNWKKQYEVPFKSINRSNFFTKDNKLYYFEDNGKVTEIAKNSVISKTITGDILHDPKYLAGKKNYNTYWSNTNSQTFIYLRKNLYQLHEGKPGEMSSKLVLTDFDLDNLDISSIYYNEKQGRFFLGSISKGLYVLTIKPFQVINSNKKLSDNVFYAQTPFDSSSILTSKGSISKNYKKNSSKEILPPSKLNEAWNPYSILTDKTGYIWAMKNLTVYQIDKKNSQSFKEYFIHSGPTQLYQGQDSTIWIGTKSGLISINSHRNVPAIAGTVTPQLAFPLPGTKGVSYMVQQSSTVLWAGTGNGLYKLFLKTGKKELIPGTENYYIRSIYISPKSPDIWFTVYKVGLFLYQNNKLIKFPLDRAGYLSSAHCIIADKKGFFWLPTNHGLFQVSVQDLLSYAKHPAEIYYHYYDKSHGFHTNEFNGGCQPCSVRLDNGMVSLPSLDGLVWFNPEKINPDVPSRPLLADRFGVQGKIEKIENDLILLNQDPEQVVIYLTTPYFGNPANLSVSYSLSKSGNPSVSGWLPVSNSEMAITLGEIKSGNYKLFIRKKNGFGINNYTYKIITIIVPLHWYETSWFPILCILTLSVIIFTYFRLRIRFLKNSNLKLETAITIRTQELQKTLNALRISENELARQMHIQTRLIASISHDVITPLGFVRMSSKRLGRVLLEKDYALAEEMSELINDAVNKAYNLIENLTNFAKSHVYGKHVKMETVDIHELVCSKINLFSVVIKENENKVVNEVPLQLKVQSHAHLLGILIHNLLDNANKYCQNGHIRIYTIENDSSIHLIISDSGPGMPEALTNWLNNSAHGTVEDLVKISAIYQGLGFILLKEITSMLNINILVKVKNGTAVHLILGK